MTMTSNIVPATRAWEWDDDYMAIEEDENDDRMMTMMATPMAPTMNASEVYATFGETVGLKPKKVKEIKDLKQKWKESHL